MANFSGRWFTTFGPMELTQDGNRISGSYSLERNSCRIEGAISDGRFQFTYQEPSVEGEGWFELVRHGKFAGQWRPKGSSTWSPWIGSAFFFLLSDLRF